MSECNNVRMSECNNVRISECNIVRRSGCKNETKVALHGSANEHASFNLTF